MARPKSNELKIPKGFISTAFFFMGCGAVLAILSIMAFKPKPILSTAELDIKIVALGLKESRAHCRAMKARNWIVDTSGLNVKSGCPK